MLNNRVHFESMKFGFLLIIIVILFESCAETNSDVVFVRTFNKNVELSSETIKIKPLIFKPEGFLIVDSTIVILQPEIDPIFTLLELQDCSYKSSFGRKGKGPNEFYDFKKNTFRPFYSNNSGFAISNQGTVFQYYSIEDILNNDFVPFRKYIVLPGISLFRAIVYCSDTAIIAAPYGTQEHIIKYNLLDKTIDQLLDYPIDLPLLSMNSQKSVFGCYIANKPDNSMVATTYASMGLIRIMDLSSKKETTLQYENFPSLMENLNISKTSSQFLRDEYEKVFSWGIKATNKFIYVKVYNKFLKDIVDKHGPVRSFVPEIHVFTWTGEPYARITLDKFFAYFDVDMSDNNIYTIDDEIEDVVLRYNISEL